MNELIIRAFELVLFILTFVYIVTSGCNEKTLLFRLNRRFFGDSFAAMKEVQMLKNRARINTRGYDIRPSMPRDQVRIICVKTDSTEDRIRIIAPFPDMLRFILRQIL